MEGICETGPTVYSPYPRRLECLTISWCTYKGGTFFSVILRPWVMVRPESNSRPPAWQTDAHLTEPQVRGFASKQSMNKNSWAIITLSYRFVCYHILRHPLNIMWWLVTKQTPPFSRTTVVLCKLHHQYNIKWICCIGYLKIRLICFMFFFLILHFQWGKFNNNNNNNAINSFHIAGRQTHGNNVIAIASAKQHFKTTLH